MQSRRREEHVTVSPASKLRAQQRLELIPDAYRSTRRDGSDQSPAQQRIMSPQKLDGLRRGVGGNKGSISFERRDYNRGSDTFERKDYNEGSDTFDRRGYDYNSGGHRCSQVESRSPPIEQARKRPQIDEGVRHRSCSPPLGLRARYELPQSRDYKDDEENLVAKRVYGYEHVNYSVNREKEFIEARLVDGQGMLDHKLMINDDAVRGSYRLSDTDITSQYEETGGHLPPLSRSVGMVRIEHERPQHRNTLPSDKLAGVESYRSGEKLRYNARDGPYSMMSSSYPKDLASASQMMDYGSSSLGTSRTDSVCSHRDGNHLRASYELPRSSGKLTDTLGFSGYEQRLPMDTSKDPETRQRTMTCPQQCVYSPNRTKHEEYLNTKLPVTAQVEHGYQCDDIPRRIAPHVQLDYEEAPMKYENREFCRPSMHPVLDTTDRDEDSYATHRRGDLHDHPALQKEKYYDCADMRTLISSKQGDDYLSPGYARPEIGKRLSQDHEISYLGASEGGRVLILRPEYESRREGGPGLQHERFHNSPFSSHNLETQRRGVRMHEIKQDPGINDHADTTLKRKYNVDEHIDVHGSRITKSSKWNSHEDVYENEEWLDEEMDVMYSSGNVGFDHKIYRKDNRDYTGLDNEEDYPSDGWLSNQDSLQHQQRRSVKFRTYYGPNVKSHPKFNSSSWYRSQHFSKGSAIPKQSKPWKQHHGYDNVHTNNEESSEDWKDATQSEPSEGSEEFMQMAHEAFLMYSKKLNLNSSVQRRYKDQGKAGSLYCIVCGRSSSKEFMDTQRLVTHAFMSHKAGLRAKHLGLHKAICVLLGWDTVVPQDTITWFPQVLPNDEAMAQKEDLILWPPLVIIHNITMSDDNPQKWKVVSMETIEAFLRGKGFVRGRIKLCLGRPADQSIILVKFLGTFIGLGDAERLHKYLSDSNRGRVEFERIKSKNGRSHEIGESGIHEDNVEHLLYGYMGIAEDLDKLDFNTKKWSLIKSKKEIEDLDNDPIKTSER